MRIVVGLAASLLALNLGLTAAQAQHAMPPAAMANLPTGPVTPAERAQLVGDLANTLERQYLSPQIGARYASMLRANLASGSYDTLTDAADFSRRITADLQAVSPDGHLRVGRLAMADRRAPSTDDTPLSERANGPPGLEDARMIGDVAFLRFNEFPDDPAVAKAARDFLLVHADAKAVILDLRPNRGGGEGVMAAILPLLYAQKTTLVRMDARASAPDESDPASDAVLVPQPAPDGLVRRDHVVVPDASETRLQHTPVYVLTSHRTASAAEHLSLALKRTHRGVLVGETTAGANHFGDVEAFGRFAAFIPMGRTYDPDTGQDWEGVGVAPDVAVAPDQALDAALELAVKAGAHPA